MFVPAALTSGSAVAVPSDEASHLTRVLRLDAGDAVRVFDGRGREWTATIERTHKRGIEVRLGDAVTPARESRIDLTLAMAVLKGDKMDEAVRDAVMLGVAAIQPLLTARTEVSAASLERGRRMARWQRIAVASAKQCGRAVVPEVRPPAALDAVTSGAAPMVMLVEPGSAAGGGLRALPGADRATLIIGPEGGWTPDEVHQARARGALLLTLGSQTFRADAMPVVALTALRVHWGDL